MKRTWIEHTERFEPGPMTPWVHRALGDVPWVEARAYDPPLPSPVPGRGYPRYHLELGGVQLEFASIAELRRCIEVLEQRHLPSTLALCRSTGMGPNSHWLSRLPARAKPWRFREPAVALLRAFLGEIEGGVGRP